MAVIWAKQNHAARAWRSRESNLKIEPRSNRRPIWLGLQNFILFLIWLDVSGSLLNGRFFSVGEGPRPNDVYYAPAFQITNCCVGNEIRITIVDFNRRFSFFFLNNFIRSLHIDFCHITVRKNINKCFEFKFLSQFCRNQTRVTHVNNLEVSLALIQR